MNKELKAGLIFEASEFHFCCGGVELGGFSLRCVGLNGIPRASYTEHPTYKDGVRVLQQELIGVSNIVHDDDDDDDVPEERHDGCYGLIATVLTNQEGQFPIIMRMLLEAGMVEVKRWTNANSGNEIALLTSPDEWPELK